MWPYLHPALGMFSVGLLFYASSVGMRARRRGKQAIHNRLTHRWVGPLAFKCYLAGWLSGVLSVYLLRDDLSSTDSVHFSLGCVAVGMLSLSALSSKRLPKKWARRVHPFLGGAALFLGIAQVLFGIEMLP